MPGKSRTIRKEIKKKQRQRRRQKQAHKRDKQLEEEAAEKQKDPEYQKWQKQQLELEEFERLDSERQQQDEEEAWLRREALAQRQFQLDAAERRCEEDKINRLREQQAQELASIKEQQRQRREERKRMAERAAAEFESMMKTMDEYLNDTDTLKPPPLELQRLVETHPQERLCEFFTRTNCCRFGHTCTHNHRRPMLAKILLIRHFFSHPLLKLTSSDDYLELTEHDLRDSYDEFFHDAVAELEKFGKIVNFRALRNTLDYLRGHVFVEYAQERHALRAFINLQGRYYASRQLNVEFSNLKGWRGAVCGLSLNRKCPKGYSCAYLHLFRNPNNLFNTDLEYTATPRTGYIVSAIKTPKYSWNEHSEKDRNWRWSESPEVEVQKSKEYNKDLATSSSNSIQVLDSQRSSSRSSQNHKDGNLNTNSCSETSQSEKSIHDLRTDPHSDSKTNKIYDQNMVKSNESRKPSRNNQRKNRSSRSRSRSGSIKKHNTETIAKNTKVNPRKRNRSRSTSRARKRSRSKSASKTRKRSRSTSSSKTKRNKDVRNKVVSKQLKEERSDSKDSTQSARKKNGERERKSSLIDNKKHKDHNSSRSSYSDKTLSR